MNIHKIGNNLADIQVSSVFHMSTNPNKLTSIFEINGQTAETTAVTNQTTSSPLNSDFDVDEIIETIDENNLEFLPLNYTNDTSLVSLGFQVASLESKLNPTNKRSHKLNFR